jgi:hypothetical protein
MHSSYLSTYRACRNEADTALSVKVGTSMTTFDKREEAFEKKYVIDEELKFKAVARRNKALGLWIAEKLGISGDAANTYARTVVAADIDGGGDAGVLRKVMTDLAAAAVALTETDIHAKMDELMAAAIAQVKAGT